MNPKQSSLKPLEEVQHRSGKFSLRRIDNEWYEAIWPSSPFEKSRFFLANLRLRSYSGRNPPAVATISLGLHGTSRGNLPQV